MFAENCIVELVYDLYFGKKLYKVVEQELLMMILKEDVPLDSESVDTDKDLQKDYQKHLKHPHYCTLIY